MLNSSSHNLTQLRTDPERKHWAVPLAPRRGCSGAMQLYYNNNKSAVLFFSCHLGYEQPNPGCYIAQYPRLIALDYVLRKGTQSNGSGKQARNCALSDASSPHTARRESKACTSPAPALL